jgi:rhodanese-related sulfurtransferase
MAAINFLHFVKMKIMKTLVFFLLVMLTVPLQAQTEYVCLPCGYSCDQTIHKGPGTCSSCNMALVERASIKFANIGVEEFCKRIASNPDVVILDVRTPEEFSGASMDVPSFGHFKKAINVNVNELESRLKELEKFKNKEVLVYCSHSHRSPRASYLLNTKGFNNVKNLAGGVSTFTDKKDAAYLKSVFVFHSK